jgi:pilus assembly protein Flp/PilA
MVNGSTAKGQGLVEYAMIMLLVALVVIIILALLGPAVGNLYSQVVPRI